MKKYIIEFTQEEMVVINDALVQMPYFKAAPLIANINNQIKNPLYSESDEETDIQT